MTLGRCPELTYLFAAGSGIPPSIIQAILASCQALRSQAAASNLIPKIELWLRYSGVEDSELESKCNVIVEKLDPEQKVIIYEWLTRLERAADFKKNQKKLAEIVCSILKDLNNEEFRQLALIQMKANNECCQDRAAMALNELYLCWQICCNCKNLPLNEKLKLIIQAGKTLALRNAIGVQLKEKEIGQGESVEIYLYLESTLAEELGLLTCIKEMSYRIFAQTQIKEISIEDLKTFVEEHYLEQAAAIPILDTLIAEDRYSKTKNDIGLIKSRSELRLTELGDMPEKQDKETEEVFQDRYLQWASKAGEIMAQRDNAILEVKINYLNNLPKKTYNL